MLNYIWISLVVIGVLVAVATDWHDISSDKYHNDREVQITFRFSTPETSGFADSSGPRPCQIFLSPDGFHSAYGIDIPDTIRQNATLLRLSTGEESFHILLDQNSPRLWKELATALKTPDYLTARVSSLSYHADRLGLPEHVALIKFDPVRFLRINAVTNDGIIGYAKTAVELAIGLIGIMALWLGVMKIAEEAGLIRKLAAILRPLTTRLFPGVPADHPAMGAMIMNISANMLGLANAATPLGLKAMEELNKLNPKAGTATDAMCTFLVINTSNVQLIPATVIAIRAAAGSANPTEILGPVIVATFLSLVVGVTVVKLLAKLPVYRKQLEASS